MNQFPATGQSLFHVRTQKPCIALGGCPGSRLVTIRFASGMVASVRQAEVVPNEPTGCAHCGARVHPEHHGVCKGCKQIRCPRCRRCLCE